MKYICHRCHGKGQIICSGPEWDDYETTCNRCGGTGKLLTEIPLEEYEGLNEEVAELKQELIATRSRLVDVEKALELASEHLKDSRICPLCFDDGFDCEDTPELDCHEEEDCWKEYFLKKARADHDASQIQSC